jgi:DNA-binding response OmpR family regulator
MSMEHLPRKPSAVVLVVESDVLRRHEMAARLRRGGFEVFEAADAAEAITVLKSIVVDVLISNVDLRGRMEGIDVARRVRQCYVDTSVTAAARPSEMAASGSGSATG